MKIFNTLKSLTNYIKKQSMQLYTKAIEFFKSMFKVNKRVQSKLCKCKFFLILTIIASKVKVVKVFSIFELLNHFYFQFNPII